MAMNGVLPCQRIGALIAQGAIAADIPVMPAQIQPASLDLRLGAVAYRVRASFLTGAGRKVADRLSAFTMHEVSLTEGAVLEKGCVYVVPLMERLALPPGLQAVANAKSSTGRLDLLTRTITVYTDVAAFQRSLAIPSSNEVHALVVARDGTILARGCGDPDDASWPAIAAGLRVD